LRIEPHRVTSIRGQLIRGKHLTNPDEHQVSLVRSDELHPAEPHSSVAVGVVGVDDLVRRQRHSEAGREEDECAWRAVADDRQRRDPVLFPEDRRRRGEVDEEGEGVHSGGPAGDRSVARHVRIDQQGPRVDAAPQVVEVPEAVLPEVLGGMLAADAVMALEHHWRIAVQEQQRIVIRLVEQARALDPGDRALLLGANVDQLQSGAALELLPQLRRRELANRRRFVGRNVIGQGAVDFIPPEAP